MRVKARSLLGSARDSRAGDRASAIATFRRDDFLPAVAWRRDHTVLKRLKLTSVRRGGRTTVLGCMESTLCPEDEFAQSFRLERFEH
jgi:hypothetical protein